MAKSIKTIVDRCLASIDVLIASPEVEGFVVGFTSNLSGRSKSYRGVGIPHIYCLEVDLEVEQALDIEKALFEACTSEKQSARFKKYHPEKREQRYRRSRGGTSGNNKNSVIYVACF